MQFVASIWHGGKTPTGANVHGAKQLKRDVGLLQVFFLHKIYWTTATFGRKISGCVAFHFSQNKISITMF